MIFHFKKYCIKYLGPMLPPEANVIKLFYKLKLKIFVMG
jgi:hypothetical protein